MGEIMQCIVLASRPDGPPAEANFRLEEAERPLPAAGEVLVEILWLSLDPYMRGRMDASKSYAAPVEIGATMDGEAIGRVLASRANGVAEGDIVAGMFGWASHGVLPGNMVRRIEPSGAPIQTALGVLGMPGFTGWLGLNSIGQPKPDETLVVGAATGAVGSMVGQLAKLAGLRTVGVAGGPEKCTYAVEELGFDACIDHHRGDANDLRQRIVGAAPDGVDIYYENVGAKTLEAVLPLMNDHGRIPVCGTIGWYSGVEQGENLLPRAWRAILVKRLTVKGFIILDHFDQFPTFQSEVAPFVTDGRIKYRESITEGLSSAPAAFLDLLKGGNFGKQLVEVAT